MTTTPAVSSVEARLERQETRLEGFGQTLNSVVQALSGLSDKLDRKGQTPWGVIWSALSVMLAVIAAIGGLAYLPIKDGQSDLKNSLLLLQERSDKRIEALTTTQVSRAEHEVHWRMQEREVDSVRERIGRVEDRLTGRLERLEGMQLKR